VKLIGSDRTPDRIVNAKSVENALRVLLALGGSTNAVIHLTAIAGRAGVKVALEQLNKLSDSTPVLVNLKPVGNGYMEDFFASGGMGALLRELKPLLHLDCMTVTGETLGERLAHDAPPSRSRRSSPRAKSRSNRRGAGCAVWQSRPEGRHPQALGGRRKTVRARG
jgi:dihydroxy-acid dehydratase